jgi:ABC-type polar amino acid transport system ATPase subunit
MTVPLPDAILSLVNVSKSFGTHRVLQNVSLQVIRGQVTAIIGPSGGGKSTLLRCFNLLETPDSGSISFDGVELFCAEGGGMRYARSAIRRKARSEMPMVFQSFNLFNNLNVIDNVLSGPIIVQKRARREALEDASRILARVGLHDKHGAFPHELSGGQRQRVAIARALAMHPKMVLFDEPTSALDPELVSGVLDMIQLLADDGMTLVIVTHEMGFARELATTVAFVADGGILKTGTPAEIFDNPKEGRVIDFVARFRREAGTRRDRTVPH